MTEIKTDPKLLFAMKRAAVKELSQYEAAKQRISLVIGSISTKNTATKEQIKYILEKSNGIKGAA
jgi:uncharacterized protein YgbK (DUF1537 family)